MNVTGPRYLDESRQALAGYIHCRADDIVYVTNPSYAVNIIAKSFMLSPGDEILSTDLEYGACDMTWNYYCKKNGASYVRRPIRLPLTSRERFVEDLLTGINSRTKAIFLSHLTSATALILPVEEVCAVARQKGIVTIVDGAHAPGQLPLDLSSLRPDIYIGACHKWMMTPKGSSFLYIRKELQQFFDPLLISWGYGNESACGSRFLDYHQGQGTRDFSAFLTIPRAIRFMEDHQWTAVAAACRNLVRENAGRFADLLATTLLCPAGDPFLGQMLSIPVDTPDAAKLKRRLFGDYRIEIAVNQQDRRTLLRYSVNGFNGEQDLDRLYSALQEIAAENDLLVPGAVLTT